jgi:hypothetical protein
MRGFLCKVRGIFLFGKLPQFFGTDQSIEVRDRHNDSQICKGTLRQLLNASRTGSGPILNAMSLPLSLSGVEPSALSSEVEAWLLTQGLKFCPQEAHFPVGPMRWGSAATRGATHWIHIDNNGLGSFVEVKCGAQWWIVFGPPVNQDKHAFGSVELFMNDFDTNGIQDGRWRIHEDGGSRDNAWVAEAVLLSAGSRL